MNSITIVGRMACEPETKQVGEYTVCEFRIGESTFKVDKATGKKISYFWTIKAWGKVGETIQNYCHQGDQIIIAGSVEQEKWIDKTTGQPREKAVINARSMEFGAKPQGQGQPAPQRQPPQRPPQNPPGYGPRQGAPTRPAQSKPDQQQYDERAEFEQAAQSGMFDAPPQHQSEEEVPF